jgi:hypothetical protein
MILEITIDSLQMIEPLLEEYRASLSEYQQSSFPLLDRVKPAIEGGHLKCFATSDENKTVTGVAIFTPARGRIHLFYVNTERLDGDPLIILNIHSSRLP